MSTTSQSRSGSEQARACSRHRDRASFPTNPRALRTHSRRGSRAEPPQPRRCSAEQWGSNRQTRLEPTYLRGDPEQAAHPPSWAGSPYPGTKMRTADFAGLCGGRARRRFTKRSVQDAARSRPSTFASRTSPRGLRGPRPRPHVRGRRGRHRRAHRIWKKHKPTA